MGKDLKGKELGVGISQRKDGLYTGRFTDKRGNRKQRYFKKLQDCRQWLADAQFDDEHNDIQAGENMTVNAWFDYWIAEIKGNNVRVNTAGNYERRYEKNIKKYIGNMFLNEVKPLHCQNVLNHMIGKYANSTIEQTRITMHGIFEGAFENEFILRNPVTNAVKCKNGNKSKDKRVLTISEQKLFVEDAMANKYYNQFAFILQTGLRIGEMQGLKWSDIDFKNKLLTVNRNMQYEGKGSLWRTEEPKTKSGYRTIPLTKEAINILEVQREKNKNIKIVAIDYADFVFVNKKGKLIATTVYNNNLRIIAEKLGIEKFSMHTLRHTFATRCIEAGMQPKTLQNILGHSSIKMTMDLYVHVTEEQKFKEIDEIADKLKLV